MNKKQCDGHVDDMKDLWVDIPKDTRMIRLKKVAYRPNDIRTMIIVAKKLLHINAHNSWRLLVVTRSTSSEVHRKLLSLYLYQATKLTKDQNKVISPGQYSTKASPKWGPCLWIDIKHIKISKCIYLTKIKNAFSLSMN